MRGVLSSNFRTIFASALTTVAMLIATIAHVALGQELRGHGGPVRALAVTTDGRLALSGSFDTAAILWGIDQGAALTVLRHHDGPVNAVAILPQGFATGGEDGRLALWAFGRRDPVHVLTGHEGAVTALALGSGARNIASASFDGTVRLWSLAERTSEAILRHRAPLSALTALPAGGWAAGGHDGTLFFLAPAGAVRARVALGVAVNALTTAGETVVAGTADGRTRFFASDGTAIGDVTAAATPIIALAATADGSRVAAAAIRGTVAIIDSAALRVERTLVGPGLPVWSVAFRPGGSELLTGGGDRLVRRWDAATGEHRGAVMVRRQDEALARFEGDRGADVFRACIACHTLNADDGPRAGPTLAGVMGRRIATAPDYDFSPALRAMDIVWTRETIARLFEIGPNAYTPGTKMPEQIVSDPDDRTALVEFIARATMR